MFSKIYALRAGEMVWWLRIFAVLKEDPSLHPRVLRMVQPITPVLGDLMCSIASMGSRHAHDINTHTQANTQIRLK